MNLTRTISRFVIAFLVITYGFAKLNGSQFTILDSELDKPMGQGSGLFSSSGIERIAVFRHRDGSYDWHHFELDPEAKTITIWKYWLQKGAKLYEGNYNISEASLLLKNSQANKALMMTLKRRGG